MLSADTHADSTIYTDWCHSEATACVHLAWKGPKTHNQYFLSQCSKYHSTVSPVMRRAGRAGRDSSLSLSC